MKRVVLMPVFNDWTAAEALLARLGAVLHAEGLGADVLVVDDGSTHPVPAGFGSGGRLAGALSLLRLRRNLGHERAIAVGLAFLHAQGGCDETVVMDADGEDDPVDVPRLVAQMGGRREPLVVFAGRARRSEGALFRLGYLAYRVLHRALTGLSIRFGSFSLLNGAALGRLVAASELWNHYAAAVVKSRLPYEIVATRRGTRLAGSSAMNIPALVIHGLSALSVYSEMVGIRVLFFLGGLMALLGTGLVTVVAVRLFTPWAVPGWASTVGGLILVLMAQTFLLLVGGVFFVLHARSALSVIPSRDHVHFLLEHRVLRVSS